MEPEATRQQFPFYNELQAIFAARMQRMLWAEAEGGSNKKKVHLSSEDEEEGNEETSEGDHKGNITSKKKKKRELRNNIWIKVKRKRCETHYFLKNFSRIIFLFSQSNHGQ